MNYPAHRRTIIATLLTLAFGSVHAQDSAATLVGDAAAATSIIDSIVVLGSSRHDATVLTSSSPIDVITPQQLKETGAVSLNQALSRLHPSFNFPQGQNAVKGQGVRSASLRGISPAFTLVLVNGRRFHRSALLGARGAQAPDLAQIPIDVYPHPDATAIGAAAMARLALDPGLPPADAVPAWRAHRTYEPQWSAAHAQDYLGKWREVATHALIATDG